MLADPRVAAVEAALVRFRGLREPCEETRQEALRFVAMFDALCDSRFADKLDPLGAIGLDHLGPADAEQVDDRVPDV